MKATEQYFPVVLYVMLYEVVLTFESINNTLQCDYKVSKQFFSPNLFIMLYKMVLIFTPVDKLCCVNLMKSVQVYFPMIAFVLEPTASKRPW